MAGKKQRPKNAISPGNEGMKPVNQPADSLAAEPIASASQSPLQSVNEELSALNSRLNEKVDELTETSNDLANLLKATDIATIFLDSKLQIRRFTPRATELLNLITSDLGRPIAHLAQNFTGIDLAADAGRVLQDLSPLEREVQARDARWYTVRILPYRTLDNRIDGIVVTFSNVTRLKDIENRLQYEKSYAERITETMRHPLLVLDGRLQVLSANPAFYETFQVEPDQTTGRKVYDLGNRQWDIPKLRSLLDVIISTKSEVRDFQVEHDFADIGPRIMRLNAGRIETPGEQPFLILLAIEDVTEREQARAIVESLAVELENRVQDRTSELAQAVASLKAQVHERLTLNQELEQRVEQLRALAIELTLAEQQERKRLSHILHDDLQQLLVGAKFHISSLRGMAKTGTSLTKGFRELESLLTQSIQLSRTLAVDLAPPALSDHGLAAALRWSGTETKRIHGLAVRVIADQEIPADDQGVAVLLFQAVRELLLNIVKHAQTKSATVRLRHLAGNQVQIEVVDKGAGFDPDAPRPKKEPTKGLGLFSIQERLAYIGGRMEVHSAPGKGTRVILVADISSPKKNRAA